MWSGCLITDSRSNFFTESCAKAGGAQEDRFKRYKDAAEAIMKACNIPANDSSAWRSTVSTGLTRFEEERNSWLDERRENEEQCQSIPMPYHFMSGDRRLQRKFDSASISGPTTDDDRRDKTDGPSSSTPKDYHKQSRWVSINFHI